MIVLHGFGPGFGLPDPSPFVLKAELLLKLAGLPYRIDTKAGLRKAPKGKLPFITDDGAVIADSTLIRLHLEKKYGIDFDKGLSAEQKAVAWSVEKMCEDHLYWFVVEERWADDANFAAGPAKFFEAVPAPLRPLIVAFIRRKVRRDLLGQGTSRHTPAERAVLAERAIGALAGVLGDKPYLMGAEPCGADATVYGAVACGLCPMFKSPVRTALEARPNLVAYAARMRERFYG